MLVLQLLTVVENLLPWHFLRVHSNSGSLKSKLRLTVWTHTGIQHGTVVPHVQISVPKSGAAQSEYSSRVLEFCLQQASKAKWTRKLAYYIQSFRENCSAVTEHVQIYARTSWLLATLSWFLSFKRDLTFGKLHYFCCRTSLMLARKQIVSSHAK